MEEEVATLPHPCQEIVRTLVDIAITISPEAIVRQWKSYNRNVGRAVDCAR